ncbi:6-phosphogluconolactonase [Nocardioides sp. Soil805]|uniref:6-phosphogluconolactonase n=1 Tax=Nocardioides sp. Soil805 TaxID=1736416 RepID=UPI0007035C25|nr:6-phosphogluconolactonase [Nocardioides sp. Soil805]KRF36071.1 6-phosphogluconolactonase [Nocardioides sp. Soil805]
MAADPRVVVHEDAQTLAGDVASMLLDRLEAAQARGEVPHVGLTGGTIADAIHREVARRAVDSSVDWSRVDFWWGDERFVEAGSPDRNARQAREAFLDGLGIDPGRVHEVPAADVVATAEDAAAAYSEAMRTQGAGFFEVLMLGVGPDGHIASLFPGHPGLDATDAIAVAVHDSPKPPPDRVSLTFEAMDRARAVWFLVSGDGKADAVAAALAGGDVHEIPARGVVGTDETLWLLDEAAASSL